MAGLFLTLQVLLHVCTISTLKLGPVLPIEKHSPMSTDCAMLALLVRKADSVFAGLVT